MFVPEIGMPTNIVAVEAIPVMMLEPWVRTPVP